MTATIVPFSKKVAKKKFKAAEEGVELDPPSEDDIKGFINTLNFLMLQSITRTVTIETMGDEMTLFIAHHDDLDESNSEVTSASCLEFMAGCNFDFDDKKKLVKNIQTIFERLDIDNYEDDETK